ncbi:hypothetical protein K2173_013156 [Erythroxylum novogranatense]|uniref:Reverse transcriptase Ty1/copia-type domain-containing protein n=1 Tax=Erythroxylum novogranatense TaxID=1862640 RepID=A0AAV8S4H7_9ROSI|nr:hypothetical protein K2173_013156 [Erythroxylum novogranatense]
MEAEISMIEKNKTWELVARLEGRKVIGVKWVYWTKLNADSSINKYKARLVVKGYAQIFGVDYSKTFSPVARLDIIRMLLAIAAQNRNNMELIEEFKQEMKQVFEMTDLGLMSYFLGMEIKQSTNEVFL